MGHRTAFYYDNRSNLTCVLDPDNGLTYYEHDAGNRMTSVKNPFGEVTYYEYTVGGQVQKRTLGNGTITYYEYDAIGQVKKVDDRKSDMSLICSFEYERDPVGTTLRQGYGRQALPASCGATVRSPTTSTMPATSSRARGSSTPRARRSTATNGSMTRQATARISSTTGPIPTSATTTPTS